MVRRKPLLVFKSRIKVIDVFRKGVGVMGRIHGKVANSDTKEHAPALTQEARENEMISLAIDLAEKQLAEGTASSSVIVHYLKLGTTKEKLEKEKLRQENELLKAKTEALQSAKRVEELYSDALKAMRMYSGGRLDKDESDL